jgi:hypothetical protein
MGQDVRSLYRSLVVPAVTLALLASAFALIFAEPRPSTVRIAAGIALVLATLSGGSHYRRWDDGRRLRASYDAQKGFAAYQRHRWTPLRK